MFSALAAATAPVASTVAATIAAAAVPSAAVPVAATIAPAAPVVAAAVAADLLAARLRIRTPYGRPPLLHGRPVPFGSVRRADRPIDPRFGLPNPLTRRWTSRRDAANRRLPLHFPRPRRSLRSDFAHLVTLRRTSRGGGANRRLPLYRPRHDLPLRPGPAVLFRRKPCPRLPDLLPALRRFGAFPPFDGGGSANRPLLRTHSAGVGPRWRSARVPDYRPPLGVHGLVVPPLAAILAPADEDPTAVERTIPLRETGIPSTELRRAEPLAGPQGHPADVPALRNEPDGRRPEENIVVPIPVRTETEVD